MIDGRGEYEFEECHDCGGTGHDASAWDERCVYCSGSGEVKVYLDERDDREDDE